MTKLITGLFAVAFALGAHAAATDWSFLAYLEDVNGTPLEGTVSLFLDGVSLGSPMVIGAEEYATAKGDFQVDVGTLKAVAEITNFSDGTGKLEYTYVIDSLPLDGYPDVASSLDQIGNQIMDNVTAFNSIDLDAGIAANGYEVIPEPTTGLLVLLGVAGLALKRKRA